MPIEGIPAPKVEGTAMVVYRCQSCFGMIRDETPEWAGNLPYHAAHLPEDDDGA